MKKIVKMQVSKIIFIRQCNKLREKNISQRKT